MTKDLSVFLEGLAAFGIGNCRPASNCRPLQIRLRISEKPRRRMLSDEVYVKEPFGFSPVLKGTRPASDGLSVFFL